MTSNWSKVQTTIIFLVVISRGVSAVTAPPHTSDMPLETTSGSEPGFETMADNFTSTEAHTTTSSQSTSPVIVRDNQAIDDLKAEADSLRAAVIALGVLLALAIVLIIIGVIWMLMKRLRSQKMEDRQNIRMSTIPTNDAENVQPTKAKKTTEKENETNKSSNKYTGVSNLKTPNSKTQEKLPVPKISQPVGESTQDSVYQPVEYPPKPENVTANQDSDVYENSESGKIPQDDREIYEEFDESMRHSDPQGGSKFPHKGDLPRPPSIDSTLTDTAPDEIYANCEEMPEAGGNYSPLDPATQYTHFYN